MNINLLIPDDYRGQFTIYQVDMNEINLGPYLLTRHRIPQLLYRAYMHAWNLVKTIFIHQNKGYVNDLEMQLVLKVIDMNQSHRVEPSVVSLGNYNQWEENIYNWFNFNIDGCNLYVDMFYILTYEKSAV